jgi:WD40 repeat protein/serine/threonine protein kinase
MSIVPWERVKGVFSAAMAASVVDRAAVLDRECAGDADLRREVESLLNARTLGGVRTGGAARLADQATSGSRTLEKPGDVIGAYRLLNHIGEGGFGVVYHAEQLRPVVRPVALKVIKPGMDTEQVIARFQHERQALAMMAHPNIAHVFEAGTTDDGRPYFVMELVRGEAITKYCDRERLSIRERLELFDQVCKGVQHAHSKAIIHRDIKPSNILVSTHDGKPFVKVIDFGIAKATGALRTALTLGTEHAAVLGTPGYMSPEQASGSIDIDTRTDVYSLGVLLFELLTASTPFDRPGERAIGLAELQRRIREDEPPSPSARLEELRRLGAPGAASPTQPTAIGPEAPGQKRARGIEEVAIDRRTEARALLRLVRGELDWIVAKAMAKEPVRRYDSPSRLADDLRRHLTGEAISAARPSTAYALRKLARRNKWQVLTTGGILLGVGAGVGTASYVLGTRLQHTRQELDAVSSQRHEQEDRLKTTSRVLLDASTQMSRFAGRAEPAAPEFEGDLSAIPRMTSNLIAEAALVKLMEAGISLHEGNLARASVALEATPAEHRAWEWAYLRAQCDHALLAQRPFAGEAYALAFSPDGAQIAMGGSGNSVWLLEAARDGRAVAMNGHAGPVYSVAFSPDGSRVVSGSRDGTARVWDRASGQELLQLRGHADELNDALFSPKGDMVLTSGQDGRAMLWDARSGQQLRDIDCGPDPQQGQQEDQPEDDDAFAIFDPRGERVLTRCGSVVRTWAASPNNESEGALIDLRGHTARVSAAAWSPDGALIATAGDTTVRVWSASTGVQIGLVDATVTDVRTILFTPDASRIVIQSAASGEVLASDVRHLRDSAHSADGAGASASLARVVLELRGDQGWLTTIAISPDGSRLASLVANTVRVWDASLGRPLATLGGHGGAIHHVAWSPDGSRIATAGADGSVRVWDAQRHDEADERLAHESGVNALAFSHDATTLASAGADATVRLWDAVTGNLLLTMQDGDALDIEHATSLAFTRSGVRLVGQTRGSRALVWDLENSRPHRIADAIGASTASPDGRRIVAPMVGRVAVVRDLDRELDLPPLEAQRGGVNAAAYSPDGKWIITCHQESVAMVWDAATLFASARLEGHEGAVTRAGLSPDGSRAWTIATDRTLRWWSLADQRTLRTIPLESGDRTVVVFSPDGARALVWPGSGPRALALGTESGDVLATIEDPQARWATATFTPDGARLAIGSGADIRVWDPGVARSGLTLKGHRAEVQALAFSPDGSVLASGSSDGLLRFWHASAYRERFSQITRARADEASLRARAQQLLRDQPDERAIRDQVARDQDLTAKQRRSLLGLIHASRASDREMGNQLRQRLVSPRAGQAFSAELLAQAREAAARDPQNPMHLTTLGVALYHDKKFDQSLEHLRRSEALLRGDEASLASIDPTNWAYIALAHWGRGDKGQAREALERLRSLVQSPEHATHVHDRMLLNRVQGVIAHD